MTSCRQTILSISLSSFFGALVSVSVARPVQSQYPSEKSPTRITTNEVIVPVTVTDTRGEAMLDLSKDQFRILDNNVEQKIDYFQLGGDPLAVALVIETSNRLDVDSSAIHRMGITFAETVMALDGEAAVITYDSSTQVRQPFTKDHDAVQKAIAETKFDGIGKKLYDAMDVAVDLLRREPLGHRRIMLVVGESQDVGSEAKLSQIVLDSQRENITIYAVGPSSTLADLRGDNKGVDPIKVPGLPEIRISPCIDFSQRPCSDVVTPAIWLLDRVTNEVKHHQLAAAASATGGIHYRALKVAGIGTAVSRIGAELHAQYVLSYAPNNEPLAEYHKITVVVSRQGAVIRSRPGYYLDVTPDDAP